MVVFCMSKLISDEPFQFWIQTIKNNTGFIYPLYYMGAFNDICTLEVIILTSWVATQSNKVNYLNSWCVIKWKHFPRNWPFVREIHRSPVNSPHKGQWRGALMFSLIWVWINDWVNNGEAGDLRRYRIHYDVTEMSWAYDADIFVWLEYICRRKCIRALTYVDAMKEIFLGIFIKPHIYCYINHDNGDVGALAECNILQTAFRSVIYLSDISLHFCFEMSWYFCFQLLDNKSVMVPMVTTLRQIRYEILTGLMVTNFTIA